MVIGVLTAAAAAIADPDDAKLATEQVWPAFVLVTGLLLVGLVADDDGIFSAGGHLLARFSSSGVVLFAGSVALVGVVTAVLNLDTSVVFLTPVLVYAARIRGGGEAPLLYGCLMLSNAGSLILPGSNLTNLIVLGHLHLSGHSYLSRMWLPSVAALIAAALVIGVFERRSLRLSRGPLVDPERVVRGIGLAATLSVAVLVIVLRSPAVPVLAVGVAAIGVRIGRGQCRAGDVLGSLGLPVLVGLFGLAVALGTAGRSWSGPALLLSHLDAVGAASLGAGASVLVNNLPAASLLAARTPKHPFALLVGLNLGPNLFVTGSLAWILWIRAAVRARTRPSLVCAVRLGVVVVPVSIAVALGALALLGSR